MKTQLSKPSRSKASYTDEYKREALELWRASGRSAAKVATELGIRPPLLYRWARTERAPAKHLATRTEAPPHRRGVGGGKQAPARRERQTVGAA